MMAKLNEVAVAPPSELAMNAAAFSICSMSVLISTKATPTIIFVNQSEICSRLVLTVIDAPEAVAGLALALANDDLAASSAASSDLAFSAVTGGVSALPEHSSLSVTRTVVVNLRRFVHRRFLLG